MKSKFNNAEINLNIQYLKDLNFENPKAPQIYTLQNLKPETKISFDLNATKLQNDTYEVEIVLNAEIKSTSEKEYTMFTLDCVYAGVFTIKDVEENLIQENLFIDCPTLLFPFMRRIISDTTRDANFPPLTIDMIDFETIFNNKKNTLKNA